MAKDLKNGQGKVRTDEELARLRGSGAFALAVEFGGTFKEDNHCCGDGIASEEFTPDVTEERERVFGSDPLRRFVSPKEVSSSMRIPWCGGNWGRNVRLPR